MTWAEKEYQGKLRVVKVEHDRAKELVERYGVYGLPGFLVVKEGKMLEGSLREGAMSKKKLIVYIEEQTGLKAAAA
jgi:thioredoxin 1